VLLAMSAHWAYGTPLLLTEHGMYLRERFIATPPTSMPHHQRVVVLGFLTQLTSVAYDLATAIAPGSEFNRGWELVSGADDDKIIPIHNGVQHELFWPPTQAADPNTLVWVGRLDPLKDVKTLLRAFAVIAARRADVRLRIFGGTPKGNESYVRECMALHEELGLGDRAVFEGRVPSIVEAYQAGKVVVSTSISEGFPYSVLEAMASGRAVVATDVGGVAEAIGEAGVMVAPRDASALADACLVLLGDPRRATALGRRARRRVAAQFTLSLCLQRYRELYASIDDRSVVGRGEVTAPVKVAV
jgi:glycosyltransferase involved in cell wall biosynthesis